MCVISPHCVFIYSSREGKFLTPKGGHKNRQTASNRMKKNLKRTVLTGKVNFESKTEPDRFKPVRFQFQMNGNRPEPNRTVLLIINKLIIYIHTCHDIIG